MLEAGSTAPAFDLPSSTGDRVRLADFAGKTPVVLVFYPFSFSPLCEGELCSFRDDPSSFEANGAQVVAVSADSSFVQTQWADEKGFKFPVLSDFWPHGEVSRAYGVFKEALGCSNRGTLSSAPTARWSPPSPRRT